MVVLAIGSAVIIGDNIPGIIVSIMIKGNNRVLYEVAWWNGRERKLEWLESSEVEQVVSKDARIEQIGFVGE